MVLLILPAGYLAYLALCDPKINFLPISLKAGWALHPDQEILAFQGNPVSLDVAFRREFQLEDLGSDRELVLTAFKEMEILLNDQTLYRSPAQHNWKRAVSVSLSKHVKPGLNLLEVRVRNETSVPALLVENPKALRTRGSWNASLAPQYADSASVVSPLQDGPPRPLNSAVGADPGPFYKVNPRGRRWIVVTWLTLMGGVAASTIPAFWKRVTPEIKRFTFPRWVKITVPFAILGAVLFVHINNALHYPWQRNPFDSIQHLDYVQHVVRTWRLPRNNEGWEMYQPPLYYFCAAAVYSLAGGGSHSDRSVKAVTVFSAVAAWGLLVVAWLCSRRVFPERPTVQWLALLFSASIPMCLYTSPFVGNEVFAATLIGFSLYGLVVIGTSAEGGMLVSGAAGFLTGLALLSKYTAFFVFLAGVLFLFFRALARSNVRDWANLCSYVGIVLLISGWFYARNVREYGNPFVGNWDQVTGFQYHQNPGYRSAGFYFSFGRVFFHHPERAPWISWADGNYASMWADVYRAFLNVSDPNVYSWIVIQLLFALLPSFVILLGFFATVQSVWREPPGNADILLVGFSVWLWQSLIVFTLDLPFGSTIKAFFFLSMVPVFAIYLIRGRDILNQRFHLFSYILDINLMLLGCISALLYRYSG
jgi:4-amino-4-deoxy-L-arabinose transferase-like glycosyltransferase